MNVLPVHQNNKKMKNRLLFILTAMMLTTATIWIAACQKDNTETGQPDATLSADDRTNGNSKVFPPTAHPYGKSYEEWTVDWMQEFMTFNCDENPWLNPANGVLFYENGPVYFVAGLSTPGASANITVPHGKAILFPLVNLINDYPCPDPSFEPAPGQTLAAFLTEGAINFLPPVTNMAVTVDGDAVSNLANYQFITDMFTFTGDPSLSGCFDGCITGSPQYGVTNGYYVMLKPLSKGTHTVHYHMEVVAWGAVQDGTFNITIP